MKILRLFSLTLLMLLTTFAFTGIESNAGMAVDLCDWTLGSTNDVNNNTDIDSSPATFQNNLVSCLDAMASNAPGTSTSGTTFGDNAASGDTNGFPTQHCANGPCRVSVGGTTPPDDTIIGCICTNESSMANEEIGDTTNVFDFTIIPSAGVECDLDSFSFTHGFNVDGNQGRLLLFLDGTLIGTVDQMAAGAQMFTPANFSLGNPTITSSSTLQIRGFDNQDQASRLVIDEFRLDGNCVIVEELDCDDGVNNDNDEFTDCEEESCDQEVGGPEGQLCEFGLELSCDDGFDNDADNLIDCDDTDDCGLDLACIEPAPTMSEWGLILFAILAGGFAVWFVRRKNLEISS